MSQFLLQKALGPRLLLKYHCNYTLLKKLLEIEVVIDSFKVLGGRTAGDLFKNIDNPPALVLKTSKVDFSPVDKYEVIKKIEQIKSQVGATKLPKVYLLHGELSDIQMNELYNHPKIKAMI